MSAPHRDLIFHLLDIQARDMCVESEDEETRQVTYESQSDGDDDEFQYRRAKRKIHNTSQRREFVIHLFGATENGTSVRCDVTGFRPTIYLRLPEEKTSECAEIIKQYIESERIPIKELTIKRITKKIFYGFTANTFYPFLEITVPSLSLFRNLRNLFLDESMNYVTKRALDGPLRKKKVEVFEANLDPMLRFLHTQNIQPCGWVSVTGGLVGVNPNESIVIDCDYEQVLPTKGPRVTAPFLTASWDIECFSMTGDFPVPKRTWKKAAQDVCTLTSNVETACELIINSLSTTQYPVETLPKGMTPIYCQLKKPLDMVRARLDKAAVKERLADVLRSSDPQEAMMDLLASTLNPVVKLVGDPVIQIGTTLTRGTAESVERHLFVFPDCADIPDIVVHAYPTEKEMILGWFEWMVERNPDILIGYNVFGFDESYLWNRAEELSLIHSTSPIHQLTRLFELAGEMKLEEKFLSSSAMGDNRMYIWTTNGRLQIDLFHYIKRNNVLPSYKLDEVTKHFMSGKLKKQSYDADNQILTLEVAGAVKDVKAGRAISLLDETGETVSDKLVITEVSGSTLTIQCWLDDDALLEMEDATKWVVVKDDVSPQDIFRLHREGAVGRSTVGKYCLQDCDLVLELYKKLETFNNSMSMANVCSVPVSYIFTRGQGIKIESLIFKQCRERNILIPVLTIPSQSGSDDTYEGAIVLDPEPGFYAKSPIGVCDFASLYPSTIVSENISHDSLLWIKDFNADGTLIQHQWGSELYDECEGYAYTDIEFDIIRPDPTDTRKHPRKIACGRRICRFAQPLDGSKSTLPQITTWLLNARSAKKKEMKAEKDPERYALLDAEQLAYKLTGNSLYGQLGSSTFKIRLQALAASVTAYGRKQILFAKDAIEQFYGPNSKGDYHKGAKIVYGDTDSIFVEFNPLDEKTGEPLQGREARVATIEITDEAGALITKALASPHDFEFDKCFDPLLMFSKKRYAGNMYENNADDYVHKYMGIALKRRDNAPIVKTIFGGAMKMLLDKRDVTGAFHFVKEKCLELVEGKVSLGQLTVTKSLRADYADPSRIAHKALADRIAERDPGNAPAAGDRIGYVYISAKAGQQASKLQGDRIETPLFIKEHKLVPDYQHYIEHQLQNPISQAFGLLLEQVPGYTRDMMKGCPTLEEDLDKYLAFREAKAAELLFQDCLKRFHVTSTRNAVMHMFGGKAVVTAKTTSSATSSATYSATSSATYSATTSASYTGPTTRAATSAATTKKTTQTTQTTMSSFLLDSFLVDNIRKKERAAAKKKKEEVAAACT
jgi:DNA polymerase elongation subunit (family B)